MNAPEANTLASRVQHLEAVIRSLESHASSSVSASRARRRRIGATSLATLAIAALPVTSWAAAELEVFEGGNPIVADAVNQNFSNLSDEIELVAQDAAAATATNPPIGTVIPSLLSEVHLEQLAGGRWVLADGRDVSGTAYEALTGVSFVPDLRGVFLRGANGDRMDGLGNPEGDLGLGDYQADELLSHRHFGPGVSAIANGPVHGGHGVPSNENNASYWGGYTGGTETRPRNVTVNFYVRVEE